MTTPETLRIGAFSTLSRLSVRMLRHYDAHGVLRPADVDQFTGYRRYNASQLPEALFIRQLRDIGFSVAAIAALLPLRTDPVALKRALAVQRDQLQAEAAHTQRRIADLDPPSTSPRSAFRSDDLSVRDGMCSMAPAGCRPPNHHGLRRDGHRPDGPSRALPDRSLGARIGLRAVVGQSGGPSLEDDPRRRDR